MMPGGGDNRRRRSSSGSAKRASMQKLKAVHFAGTRELEDCCAAPETHYPTPVEARPLPQNGATTRRFTVDEVELYFSEDTPESPLRTSDYAVQKVAQRTDFLLCGCVESRETQMGISVWKRSWAELYRGILMLRRYKDKVERKRKLVPVSTCRMSFVDFEEGVLQIDYTYQAQAKRSVLRLKTKTDMFLWWWAIQLSAVVPMDHKLLIKSVSRSNLAPFHLMETSHQVENVLFPKFGVPSTSSALNIKPHGVTGTSVTHLIFIRHAETENINFRVCDRDKKLTERGKEQAEQTARYLHERLKDSSHHEAKVSLIYGGLRRTVETAAMVAKEMPWIQQKNECCFLEDGAPKDVDTMNRYDYRESMHRMAFQYICRWDGTEERERSRATESLENYKIVVCHTSFIQFCLAECYQVPKEIIQLGAPISHCSVTQIDVRAGDAMNAVFANRVTHLPLTHRTCE